LNNRIQNFVQIATVVEDPLVSVLFQTIALIYRELCYQKSIITRLYAIYPTIVINITTRICDSLNQDKNMVAQRASINLRRKKKKSPRISPDRIFLWGASRVCFPSDAESSFSAANCCTIERCFQRGVKGRHNLTRSFGIGGGAQSITWIMRVPASTGQKQRERRRERKRERDFFIGA